VDSQEQTIEILLLEDDPSVRQVTKEILRCELWQVREAANSSEGINLLAQYHSSIRLIILDLVTPGLLSGVELAEKFAHDYPQIPILLVSGRYLHSTFQTEESEANWNFLAKPYVPADLIRSVRMLLAH
jgi:DNA-binding NtrC family response regulator